jgi:hypothetical protein
MKYWKGPVTFTRKADKWMFSALSWLAKAASRDETRYFMSGMFNEVIDGNRVFVSMDGRRLHKIEFQGESAALSGIPAGKNLAFKADSKQITFTQEIDGAFPNYKQVIPDVTDVAPFRLWLSKTRETGYTEALYELYAQKVKMNAVHVEGMYIPGASEWTVYSTRNVVVCTRSIPGAVYTVVSALLRE